MTATTANSSKNSTPFLRIGFWACAALLTASCAKLPAYTDYPTQKIVTGAGPEDMALDTFTNRQHPRMLVSCSARRKTETPANEIWAVDLKTDRAAVIKRVGEPQGTRFKPHGIDIVRRPDGKTYLYVINHQDNGNETPQHIMQYEVLPDELRYVTHYAGPALTSPNDVCFAPQGGFYWSNDASNRKRAFVEPVFRIKGGYVGYAGDTGNGRSHTRFAYTNGVGVLNGDLYVSTVIQGWLFRINGSDLAAKPEKIAKIPGGDNLTFLPDGRILVTAHLRQIKFLRHLKNPEVKSPSVVYLVDPKTKTSQVLYANDGSTVSTASTAIYYDGHLYICQVFDGFIVKVKCALP